MKKVKKRRDGDEWNARVTCGCVKRENVELWAWMDGFGTRKVANCFDDVQ